MKHSSKSRHVENDNRDVARLDKAMREERQEQGAAWTEVLKRRLNKRFDASKAP